MFARAGGIVPLGPRVGWGGVDNPEELTVYVFPGADGAFTLYEDEGNSTAYLQGDYALTRLLADLGRVSAALQDRAGRGQRRAPYPGRAQLPAGLPRRPAAG